MNKIYDKYGFRFREWDIYKDARKFRMEIYQLLKTYPQEEKYALVDQTKRALNSIILNIAEGANKGTDKETKLYILRAATSLDEVIACLDCALDSQKLNSQIVFACIAPHPPIILPSVGSEEDRKKVKKTIESLESLGKKLKEAKPDSIIISAPHPDWGIEVPLHFLAREFRGEIESHLIGLEPPRFYFEEGQKVYKSKVKSQKSKVALIASGDLSHCLKEDGPYGFHPDGPKFDRDLIEYLKKKDIENILKLGEMYPEAGECGLRSFCFLLGVLEESKIDYQPEILSYEGPFGVGYLVVNFKLF